MHDESVVDQSQYGTRGSYSRRLGKLLSGVTVVVMVMITKLNSSDDGTLAANLTEMYTTMVTLQVTSLQHLH